MGALGHRTSAVLLASMALALAAIGLAAPTVGDRIDTILQRAATAAASAVARALATLIWIIGVAPIWALSYAYARATRRGVGTAAPASGWLLTSRRRSRNPNGTPADPRRTGSADPSAPRSALVTVLGIVALTALLTVSLVVVGRRTGLDEVLAGSGGTGSSESTPRVAEAVEWNGLPIDGYAHEDEPWIEAYFDELVQVPALTDFFLGYRMADFEGRYVNIVDGRRASYVPEDPEITVWFFGGSTMYGIGQRDDHTLPSVVAKAAQADGIRIRPVNFGASGYVNWQSLEQFEQALTSDLERPDLVVFYEGVNDWSLGNERSSLGDMRPGTTSRLANSDEEREAIRQAPDNPGPAGWDDTVRFKAEAILTADQYRRGSELIDALAESYDVPLVRFWQPSPFAKRPQPADQGLWERLDYDPEWLPESTRRYKEILAMSGVESIDLTAVLDDVDQPVYFDHSHTNELGARIIGDAIYAELRPQLEELSQ